jgi:tRNA U34 2-thiouridine synthase MnmA/TrmU
MKALALLSGGLDSTLAIKVAQESAIVPLEIEAIHFTTIFCRCDGKDGVCGSAARSVAEKFNIPVRNINNTHLLMEAVRKPRHGYGSNSNPCIDCRISMIHSTREAMSQTGASFIITGEVLGQRPMSQHLRALKLIEKETNLQGLILRPLSAKVLDATIPEKNKWVDRAKLLAISGRSRKEQISLADIYEIKDYPCPAGGCLLTDPAFSARMKDLLKYNPDFVVNDVLLLQVGRHFRLRPVRDDTNSGDKKVVGVQSKTVAHISNGVSDNLKLAVGRNEQENQTITNLAKPDDVLLETVDYMGPVALLRGKFNDNDIRLAAGITARYADTKNAKEVKVNILSSNTVIKDVAVPADAQIEPYRIN